MAELVFVSVVRGFCLQFGLTFAIVANTFDAPTTYREGYPGEALDI